MPDAPLDNNITERSLKMAIRLGRASLFYATTNGALVGDVFQALIYTTLLHDPLPIAPELDDAIPGLCSRSWRYAAAAVILAASA